VMAYFSKLCAMSIFEVAKAGTDCPPLCDPLQSGEVSPLAEATSALNSAIANAMAKYHLQCREL